MKSKVTTIEQLEAIGDNWLSRTRRLAKIVHEGETEAKRDKAFRLWLIMASRVVRIGAAIANHRQQQTAVVISKFQSGGIVSPIAYDGEFFVPARLLKTK